MKKISGNQIIQSNNTKNIISTPIRKKRKSKIPVSVIYDRSPSINTPKGTKIYHPFIAQIINNLDKAFTSPDMFCSNRKYPLRDSNLLSPDLIGTLFPKDINMDVEIQSQLEDQLFKQHQQLFDMKSAKFFIENIMKESPDPQDSGLGQSLSTNAGSSMEAGNSFATPATPPSKFLWNRAEYQNTSHDSSNMSFEDNYLLAQFAVRNNLESTQIDLDKSTLAENLSMRRQSIIGSPMKFDELSFSCSMESDQIKAFPRSSPFSKFNTLAMNDLNLSPIKISSCEDTDVEEDFM